MGVGLATLTVQPMSSGGTADTLVEAFNATTVGPKSPYVNLVATTRLYIGAVDLILTRAGAAALQLGDANSATPVAQTLQAQGSRGGTDTDVAGANLTVASGQGTGSGAASSLIFQTPTVGGSGSVAQTMATRFTVATAGLTATVPLTLNANGGATLVDDAANQLALRSGTNAQVLSVYNTFTSTTSYERLSITWAGNVCGISTLAGSAGGTTRALTLGPGSSVGTDIAGAALTLKGGAGTGTGAGGSIIFQVAPAGGSGSSANALGTIVTLASSTTLMLVAGGTVTASYTPLSITQAWNGAGVAFKALTVAITNTASAAGARLLELSVGGTAKLDVDVSGNLYSAGALLSLKSVLTPGGATLTAADSGRCYTNDGAGGLQTYNLPAATVGLYFDFIVATAQALDVQADGTDTIQTQATVGGAGGKTTSNLVGAAIRLVCYAAGKWIAVFQQRTWTTT